MASTGPEITWKDRPKKARLVESFVFSFVFLLVATIFIPALDMVTTGFEHGEKYYTLLGLFAIFTMPVELLLWYGVGSVYRELKFWRIATIGFLSVIVPSLLIAVLTFGLAMILWPIYLPPAIPVGIVVTWIFVRIRERLYANR